MQYVSPPSHQTTRPQASQHPSPEPTVSQPDAAGSEAPLHTKGGAFGHVSSGAAQTPALQVKPAPQTVSPQ